MNLCLVHCAFCASLQPLTTFHLSCRCLRVYLSHHHQFLEDRNRLKWCLHACHCLAMPFSESSFAVNISLNEQLYQIFLHFWKTLMHSYSQYWWRRRGLPRWLRLGKESTCSVGYLASISGSGRSPGGGHGYPLQYSYLENSMDRGAWQATVHRDTKSQTWLRDQL